jgi:glutamate mutase epsilon subunit
MALLTETSFFWRFQGQEGGALCTNVPYATVMTEFRSIGHVHIHLYIYKMI